MVVLVVTITTLDLARHAVVVVNSALRVQLVLTVSLGFISTTEIVLSNVQMEHILTQHSKSVSLVQQHAKLANLPHLALHVNPHTSTTP